VTDTVLHHVSRILVQLLVDAAQVTAFDATSGWPAWWEGMNDSPDNAVSLTDTTGISDGVTMPDGAIQEHQGFQLRVRSSLPQDGKLKISQLRQYLSESVANQLVNIDGYQYIVIGVVKLGPVLSLGREVPGSNRSAFTVNGLVAIMRR
jgi:Bacteriophage minor capsid protein